MGNLEILDQYIKELDSLTVKDERIKHQITFEGWTLHNLQDAANKYRTGFKHPESAIPYYRCRFVIGNVEFYLKSTKYNVKTTFSAIQETA